MVNVANSINSRFGIGYAEYGSDSDPFNPNQIRFGDHAAEVHLFRSSDEALNFLKNILASGSPVVVFLNTGPVSVDFADVSDFWSTRSGDVSGHYMTVTGYDEKYIYLNDPTEPEGTAKDLPTSIENFLKAWEETFSPEVGSSGPFWMLYFLETGEQPEAADVLDWNLQVGMSAPDQIRAFAGNPGEDDFSCFSYREMARLRLEFANYLESNGFPEIAALYREAGNLFGAIGMDPQNLTGQLNAVADLEEEALALMANP
jgi:hypothetical protein